MTVHFTEDGTRARCGQTGKVELTEHGPQITCRRCQSTTTLTVVPVPEEAVPVDPQEVAVDQERNHTRTEVLAFIREGDVDAAIFRMQRGFERQCRLAGLDRAVRESREKENA